MRKKKEPRSGDFDRSHFKKMTRKLKSLGCEQITRNTLERDALRLSLAAPATERIRDTKNQISFQKEKDGYKVVVHTTYDPKKKRFTELGCGWVLIAQDEKRLYARFFYRTASFVGNMLKEAEFQIDRLEKRPLCPVTHKLMVLEQTSNFTAVWKSPDKTVVQGEDFYKDTPKHLQSHVGRLRQQKRYYENVDRPRKKITKRKKDSRKIWAVGTPENAIH